MPPDPSKSKLSMDRDSKLKKSYGPMYKKLFNPNNKFLKQAKDLKEFYIKGIGPEQPSILKELKDLKDLKELNEFKTPISPRESIIENTGDQKTLMLTDGALKDKDEPEIKDDKDDNFFLTNQNHNTSNETLLKGSKLDDTLLKDYANSSMFDHKISQIHQPQEDPLSSQRNTNIEEPPIKLTSNDLLFFNQNLISLVDDYNPTAEDAKKGRTGGVSTLKSEFGSFNCKNRKWSPTIYKNKRSRAIEILSSKIDQLVDRKLKIEDFLPHDKKIEEVIDSNRL